MINAEGETFLTSRGLDVETAVNLGLASGRSKAAGDDIIIIPYLINGEQVNRKYRNIKDKKFWQDKDGIKTLWNVDCLKDPLLSKGEVKLVITEGEFDALAAIQSGHAHAVSVPDGAPMTEMQDVPPEQDKKMSYIWDNRDLLDPIRCIVIATDDDEPGRVLAKELVKRLKSVRCQFVVYPPGCKDLNDVLKKHGEQAVRDVISLAKPYPVKGLYRLSDFPEPAHEAVYETSWEGLQPHLRLYKPMLAVGTGVPGHGKSKFTLQLSAEMVRLHKWRVAIASLEADPVPDVLEELREYAGMKMQQDFLAEKPWQTDDAWIEDHYTFIHWDPQKDLDEPDLDWMLNRAADAAVRYGMDMLILDPWNEIEHKREFPETETEYHNRALREARRFAKEFNCCVLIVAHPVKMQEGKDGNLRQPTLYDIAGSAAWYNKPDLGFVVWREKPNETGVEIIVKKVRKQRIAGKPGRCFMKFDALTGRYTDQTQEEMEAHDDL